MQGGALRLQPPHVMAIQRMGVFVQCKTSRFHFNDFMCMPITYATKSHHGANTLFLVPQNHVTALCDMLSTMGGESCRDHYWGHSYLRACQVSECEIYSEVHCGCGLWSEQCFIFSMPKLENNLHIPQKYTCWQNIQYHLCKVCSEKQAYINSCFQ